MPEIDKRAAVVALSFVSAERAPRTRPLVVATLMVGAAIAVLAVDTVGDVLTVHIPGPNSTDTIAVGLSNGDSFSERLGAILPAIGTAFIALVAIVGANRLGNFVSRSRETSGEQPD